MPLSTYMQASKHAAGDWVAFKIKLPYNTKYSITGGSAYKYHNATGNLELYIAPYEGALKTALETESTYGTATCLHQDQDTDDTDINLNLTDTGRMADNFLKVDYEVEESTAS